MVSNVIISCAIGVAVAAAPVVSALIAVAAALVVVVAAALVVTSSRISREEIDNKMKSTSKPAAARLAATLDATIVLLAGLSTIS